MKLNLNGTWDFYPDGDGKRHTIVVPTWWDSLPQTTDYPRSWEKNLHHGTYKRSFALDPKDLKDDVFLHIGALATLGKVVVNGVSVGPESTKGYLMTLLPYDLDITSVARAGSNSVSIEVWSVKDLPEDALSPEEGPDRMLFPFGTENIVGRVGIGGDVFVETRPRLRVDDIQIIPDLKRNADHSDDTLTVIATLINHTPHARRLLVRAAASPAASTSPSRRVGGLTRPAPDATVEAGSSVRVALSANWADSHYWSRTDPFLYRMAVEALLPDGSLADFREDDFGMRQFYRSGDSYYFNGVKIRLRGDSLCLLNQGDRDLINEIGDAYGVILDDNQSSDAMADAWVDGYKAANANILRNHIRSIPSEELFRHADKVGMLIEEETAFWNPGSVSNVSLDPPYYLNYSDEAIGYYCEWVERWVRAYRNHPSIILWSTTNEAWNPNDGTELIPPLREAVLRNDKTRPIINDGFNKPLPDEDSRHYYGGYPSGMTSAEDIYSLYQIDSDLPLGAGEEFSVSTAGIPQYAEDGSIKDIYHGRLNGNPDTISRADFGREVGRVTRGVRSTRMSDWKPFCMSMFLYDPIERIIPLDQAHTSHGLNPKRLLRPQFDPTQKGDQRFNKGEGFRYFANSYSDVAAYDKAYDKEPRLGRPHDILAPGTTMTRTVLVYNDEEIDGTELDVDWSTSWIDTATGVSHPLDNGSRSVSVPHGEHGQVSIDVTVPEDPQARAGKFIFRLDVSKRGIRKFSEDNFLGWIGVAAQPRLEASQPSIDLGRVDWQSRTVKHCIHLRQAGGAMSEKWTAEVVDDAEGAISLERHAGNLRHEQDQFYTVNVAGLQTGKSYAGKICFTGSNGDSTTVRIAFTAGSMLIGSVADDSADGARVIVSSSSHRLGWAPATLVDGRFSADYDLFGWSSEPKEADHTETVTLLLKRPATVAQVVLVPRSQNPGGTIAEAHMGAGVGGVLEFAAGHKAIDPNIGQGFPRDFTIQTTTDRTSWTTVVAEQDYPRPDSAAPRAFDFAAQRDVTGIRLVATSLRANPNEGNRYALQLTEIAAFPDHRMPSVPDPATDITATATGHCLHLEWGFRSDGRSPITETSILLRNGHGEVIPLTLHDGPTSVTVPDVPSGTWTPVIQARNAVGLGRAFSGPSVVVPQARPDGAAPRKEKTQFQSCSAMANPALDVIVGWKVSGSEPADGYTVHLSPLDAGTHEARTGWVPAGVHSLSLPAVQKGLYRASVEAAQERERCEAPKAVIVATVPGKPNKPGVTSSGSTVSVTWHAPDDGGSRITSYVLTLRNLTRSTTSVVKADGDSTSRKVDGLRPGNYTASIIAVNAVGMSAESSPSLPCIIK